MRRFFSILALLATMASAQSPLVQLVEMVVQPADKYLVVDFLFEPLAKNGVLRVPPFIQEVDSNNLSLSISFLDTRTNIPLGEYALGSQIPEFSSLQITTIERTISKKKRPFLKISWGLQTSPGLTKYPTRKIGTGKLRLTLSPINKEFKSQKFHPGSIPQSWEDENKAVKTKDALPIEGALQTGLKIDSLQRNKSAIKVFKLKADPETLLTGNTSVRMRGDASEKSQIAGQIPAKTKVYKTDQVGAWAEVVFKGKKGFVRADLLSRPPVDTIAKPVSKGVAIVKTTLSKEQKEAELKAIAKEKAQEEAALKAAEKLAKEAGAKKMKAMALAEKARQDSLKKADIASAKLKAKTEAEAKKLAAATLKQAKLDSINRVKQEKAAAIKKAKLEKEAAAKKAIDDARAKKAAQDSIAKKIKMDALAKKAAEEVLIQKAKAEAAAKKADEERQRKEQELIAQMAARQKVLEEQRLARQAEKDRVRYSSFGKRDPFIAIEASLQDPSSIDIGQMNLVGIIWSDKEPLAILEHRTEPSISFTLKRGDRIPSGRVERVGRDEIFFTLQEFGNTRSFSLKLVPATEGKYNAPKN